MISKNVRFSTLSDSDIAEVKRIIKTAVNQYNSGQKTDNRISSNLDEYKFQLVPAINEQTEKEVFVNALCTELNDWQKHLLLVNDGGKCFFSSFTLI